MNTRFFSLLLALSLSLAACSSVRQTTPLAYPGDGRATVDSLEASIQKRGYKPVCKEREYCKFQYGQEVWIHFKASSSKVVMAIDVVDGKKMPADRRKALTDEASALGEAIWREASEDARQREIAAAEREKAEAAARAAEERREKEREAAEAKAAGSPSSGGGLSGVLGTVGGILDGVHVSTSGSGNGSAPAQSSASAHCCVNGDYYQCPSASAVNKCAGESAACLSRCMSSSDMSCGERCMKEHPPDPSGCERHSENDGQCR